MTNAIIETGGKQYSVKEGDVIFIEKLPSEAGDTVTFDRVLAVVGDGGAEFGRPTIEGASVTAKVVKNGKSKKIIVFKMRPKKGYRRKQGHRQPYTKVKIEEIVGVPVFAKVSADEDEGLAAAEVPDDKVDGLALDKIKDEKNAEKDEV